MATEWCFEGGSVNYGILLDQGVEIARGRFRTSDIETLLANPTGRFTFQETNPEDVGLPRESKDCSFCNDWKFPADFTCENIPPRLILDVKNDVTNQDIAPIPVRFELIPNPEIDRVAIVRVTWDFGDGSPLVTEEGLFGQRIGFIQNHTYQEPVNFNGTVTLEILNAARETIDAETVTFSGIVVSEPQFLPLNLIIDVFPDSTEAPANVTVDVFSNQAIENIVIDWGDGSPALPGQGTNNTHTYNQNGSFIIAVAATSRLSGQRTTFTRELILAEPPLPPAPDAIIFDVRRVSIPDPPVAPATINYTIILNPDLKTSSNKFRILWTDFKGQERDIFTDGSRSVGFSETFLFPEPGTENVQLVIDLIDEFGTIIKSESRLFTEPILAEAIEELPVEPIIISDPVTGEPIEIDPETGLPPVEEPAPPPQISNRTRNIILIGLAAAVTGGVAIAARSKS